MQLGEGWAFFYGSMTVLLGGVGWSLNEQRPPRYVPKHAAPRRPRHRVGRNEQYWRDRGLPTLAELYPDKEK
ncbi:MAG TPA: hypothetical protein VF640_00770 [Acidimicrobiales bacterium]